ncbi:conserved hypothetical protein [Pediculus humanus corporis]|uniref:Uncharacterized protein n=1 Tax=Pediculus humanus subsp. corporis TaxID=121224 RepID=E0VNC3_PEDHC|nr:uncharacterized protein Phum_PHUM333160 [Pediculus humanus corporis]EEB14879.1 conserved hypothetical protein [Pediculus humanus corporis]
MAELTQTHPLPIPKWSKSKGSFCVSSVEQYEELAASVELTVQQLIQAHNYNTVGNFIRFYESYRKSGETKVENFFRTYNPPITPEHHTCVGLGLELLKKLKFLEKKYPGLKDKFYLVSCEEAIVDVKGYTKADPKIDISEKEHVLVALKIKIGTRYGILLLDPGYHIGRVITIMKDQFYPNTGWFLQSDESQVRKEYCYIFAENSDYIKWIDRVTREGLETTSENIIYVARPYATPVQVTERRNLVYNFRSFLARDTKGHLVAGLYFPIKENVKPVLFYQNGRIKEKFNISLIVSCEREKFERDIINHCNVKMGLSPGTLEIILNKISIIMSDHNFVQQVLDINNKVGGISEDN